MVNASTGLDGHTVKRGEVQQSGVGLEEVVVEVAGVVEVLQ